MVAMKVVCLLLSTLCAVQAIDVQPVPAGVSGTAVSTRYWDSCKESCSWPGKADYASPLRSVQRNGELANSNAPSGCDSTDANAAFTDPRQQPFVVDANTALGFAATGALNGKGEHDLCCSCMDLQFTSGPATGKHMIVQITNTGGDLGVNHFDLQIPGGGVGIFDTGVQRQFGNSYDWGARYGGVNSAEQCMGLPAALHSGCRFRFDWLRGSDNPSVSFKQVQCPKQLTDISGCVRSDNKSNGGGGGGGSPAAIPPANTQCSPLWSQCGGKGFSGSTCCRQGTCIVSNMWYSQCITQQAVQQQPAVQQQMCSPKYGQCGGQDHKGATCCTQSTCKRISEWYSQCL